MYIIIDLIEPCYLELVPFKFSINLGRTQETNKFLNQRNHARNFTGLIRYTPVRLCVIRFETVRAGLCRLYLIWNYKQALKVWPFCFDSLIRCIVLHGFYDAVHEENFDLQDLCVLNCASVRP